MLRSSVAACILLGAVLLAPCYAVIGVTGTYNTSAPTGTDIPNWNTGWTQPQGQSGITGWDYVGIVGGASGVYLGNNWVITAAHVGASSFVLNGATYPVVAGSAQGIVNVNGTSDITLFQISGTVNLPSLSIATSAPTPLASGVDGDLVAMIGYGDGGSKSNKTWGLNTVTANNLLVSVSGFKTTDFETAFGLTSLGNGKNARSATNNFHVVDGDSGGGDFIYNSSTSSWQLAGINEAVNTQNNNSYFVQLSAYSSQINSIIAVPEPSSALCLGAGVVTLLGGFGRRRVQR